MLVLTTALACICPCPPLPSCNMQHAACTAAQQHATTPLLLMCALHWQATRWGRCSRAPRRPAGRRLQRRARQRGRGAARPPFLADAPPAAPSSTYALPHGIAAPPHPAHGAACCRCGGEESRGRHRDQHGLRITAACGPGGRVCRPWTRGCSGGQQQLQQQQ